MNWRRVICWLIGHKWQVFDGKRHCTACGHEPENDVPFCPKCGSEKLRLQVMVSDGYLFVSCEKCGHKFQDTSGASVTVVCSHGRYELEKPVVDQDGTPIKQDAER